MYDADCRGTQVTDKGPRHTGDRAAQTQRKCIRDTQDDEMEARGL